ncbi:MAG TPA: VIT and VWA domain-containing protein [Bryobacteraceae bacterium]|jgi:Ca-activated chloride channel family protein|nr:VIT and VWA domain-containing protein [Bryobacteraceae bacterium]
MRFALLLVTGCVAWGDAGVLVPSTAKQPDPKVLTLDEMSIAIVIDNGNAKVKVQQIFSNHTAQPIEGNYVFALPGRALISDFAIWDGATRIPGVILERKRAEEIYNDIRAQALDPGLLQMGERDADEARRTSVFSARVVPIPAYGSKRIEMEYQERLNVELSESMFAIPLRPDVYRAQTAGRLSITLEVKSAHAMRDFQFVSKSYAMQTGGRDAHAVKASFSGKAVPLTEDFSLKYALDAAKDDLAVLTYRDGGDPGFFQASALLAAPASAEATAPRTIVALFDTSLSMQWEKLEREFQALEALLRSLKPVDEFNLIVYNDKVSSYSPTPVGATPDSIEKALDFLRLAALRGGTDTQAALDAALAQPFAHDPYIVVLGDLGGTRGIIQNGKLAEWYAAKWKQAVEAKRPRTYVFAIGDDANLPLARMLARNNGVLESVRSTEPIEFKLKAFLSKIGRKPVDNLRLTTSTPTNFDLIYPLEETVFRGSMQTWVGEYKKPAAQATFTVRQARATVPLPAQNTEHEFLPRAWAKARVDALLEKIEREGEDQASIDEIIRLSRKYKFVTPYTSFLAAPRALLRPRLIRPGDPVLRVKTDESITSVVAMFPFGTVKKLRYLAGEDTWQTRFLAPNDLADGTYRVRLLLRDKQGRTYRETKTFVIASQPPVVKVKLDRKQAHRGESIKLQVSASDTTRTIVARMRGAAPVYLKWNAGMGSNTGELLVPAAFAAGRYKVTVTAEDFAHNIGSGEVEIEILP